MRCKQIYQNNQTAPEQEYTGAFSALNKCAPAYANRLAFAPIVWTSAIPTAATDGWHVYINADFFVDQCRAINGFVALNPSIWDANSPETDRFIRAGLLGHEVWHQVVAHPQRGLRYQRQGHFKPGIRFIHRIYNMAADYVGNDDLLQYGLLLPSGALWDTEIATRNDIVDEVYLTLWNKEQEQEPEKGGQPGEESDAPESGDPESDAPESGDDSSDESGDESGDDSADSSETTGGENTGGEGHDDHITPQYEGDPDEIDEQLANDEADARDLVDRAIENIEGSESVSRGFSEAGYRFSQSAHANVSWQGELADVLLRPGSDGRANWGKINRRRLMMYGYAAPTRRGNVDRIIVIKDISSSVCDESEDLFDAEFASLIDQVQPNEGAMVMFTNTRVRDVVEATCGSEYLEMQKPSGGGTYLSSALDWLEENGLEPKDSDIVLAFTDGYIGSDDWQRLDEAGVIVMLDAPIDSYMRRIIDTYAPNTRTISVA